jgi:AraC-like DNA-binding protein
MTDAAPVAFTNQYKGAPRGHRYEFWREEICRRVCDMDIGPSPNVDVIDMHSRLVNLAPVAIAIASGFSATIGRSRQQANDGGDAFTVVCHAQNPLPFHHHGRVDEIGTSDIILGDLTQASGATLGECREFTALVIERKALIAISPKAEDLLFRPLRVASEINSMIGRYATLASEAAPRLDAHGRFLMGQHLVDLCGLALGARADDAELARQRGEASARLALMQADILSSMGRSDLNIGMIAFRYGLSPRQAQRLFEQSGTTFTEYLLEHRLLAARKLLLDPDNCWRKISDIAQSAGFADLSYFNRAFRRRFGITPSDMRES